ncbi:hypothetical protein C8046_04295 [Serinibacter arcticus]|uniref:Phage shock protein PspC N-terminal domain-containing protein n=1 Tax=Serinibacter arcticus TaxID=1655435 RepID=A0A2U1ZSS5_9MICO|nr:PspC domain-containing protein [Serinibacter arcticus]PWD50011.1 hypothetical protein C8046_04295 [Serinibacter arcticus]
MSSFYDMIRNTGFRRGPSRLLGGVCSGISRQWGWDLTLVRIVVLVLMILPILSWAVYAVAWILLPWQDGSIPLQKAFSNDGKGTGSGPRPYDA